MAHWASGVKPRSLWILTAGVLIQSAVSGTQAPSAPRAQLVIVVDGLRPDYVTPELMPRVASLARRGTTFTAHHSVFPTVTRVNAASMVTGLYPESHGLLGNTVYVPAANAVRGLDTGVRANLESIDRANRRLLTGPSLGELLQRAGKKLLSVGSGSSGVVYLINHRVNNGAIIHHEFTQPDALAERVIQRLGLPPPHAFPNAAQNRRAVDAYLTVALDDIRPDVTFLWLSDPDTTAHTHGMGSEVTRRALLLVDAEIGRIEDAFRHKSLLDETNVLIVSDHGFSTHGGTFSLAAAVEPFAHAMSDGSPDIVVAEGAIHFRGNRDPARIAAIVAALQKNPAVGAIFTRPRNAGGVQGEMAGTLSFDVVRWNHPRAGDILVSANWSDAANATGIKGTTPERGTAGHGTSGPYDIHSTLIATGPDWREHATIDVPTGNADLAPTLLRLAGVPVPSSMTGRIIDEGFRSGPAPSSVRVTHSTETVRTSDGSYELTAHLTTAAGRRYLDFTTVTRPPRSAGLPQRR